MHPVFFYRHYRTSTIGTPRKHGGKSVRASGLASSIPPQTCAHISMLQVIRGHVAGLTELRQMRERSKSARTEVDHILGLF